MHAYDFFDNSYLLLHAIFDLFGYENMSLNVEMVYITRVCICIHIYGRNLVHIDF